jgi:tetratricopeptide (TPR) repeat protein
MEDLDWMVEYLNCCGKICHDKLDMKKLAVDYFREVIVMDPANSEALDNLEILHQGAEDWHGYLDILERKIELCENREERIRFLTRSALIYQDLLENVDKAIQTHRRILKENSKTEESLLALDQIFMDHHRWEDLLHILGKRIELTEKPSEIIQLHLRCAQIQLDLMKDVEKARYHLGQILGYEPEHPVAVELLRSIEELADGADSE